MDEIDVLEVDAEHIQLPTTWPTWEAVKSNTVKFANLEDQKLIRFYKGTLSDDSFAYPMTHKMRGNVIVINNEIFLKHPQRFGTEHDVKIIRELFSQFRFEVNVYDNLKCSEMKTRLLKESKADYRNHDCFILFILSHGNNGVVLGTDADTENESGRLPITEITTLFSESKTLLGKPKLFFIQACQGGQLDEGKTIKTEQIDLPQIYPVNASDEETDGRKSPSRADVFLSLATVEGYVAWRHPKYGSWYIQSIGYVLSNYAYKHDLNELMTAVNMLSQ